jgi:hypothetical protein
MLHNGIPFTHTLRHTKAAQPSAHWRAGIPRHFQAFFWPRVFLLPNPSSSLPAASSANRYADDANARPTLKEDSMSFRVQVSKVIDRPVAEVFHFLAHEHVRNHPRWDPDMQLEQVSDGPIGVGTIIRRRKTHSGTPVEGTMEVVEFEPDRAFGVAIHDGPTETRSRTTFEAEGPERTTITISAEFADLDESMESVITSLIERSARNMKDLIESEV